MAYKFGEDGGRSRGLEAVSDSVSGMGRGGGWARYSMADMRFHAPAPSLTDYRWAYLAARHLPNPSG